MQLIFDKSYYEPLMITARAISVHPTSCTCETATCECGNREYAHEPIIYMEDYEVSYCKVHTKTLLMNYSQVIITDKKQLLEQLARDLVRLWIPYSHHIESREYYTLCSELFTLIWDTEICVLNKIKQYIDFATHNENFTNLTYSS